MHARAVVRVLTLEGKGVGVLERGSSILITLLE
jgi:hypothetical protein